MCEFCDAIILFVIEFAIVHWLMYAWWCDWFTSKQLEPDAQRKLSCKHQQTAARHERTQPILRTREYDEHKTHQRNESFKLHEIYHIFCINIILFIHNLMLCSIGVIGAVVVAVALEVFIIILDWLLKCTTAATFASEWLEHLYAQATVWTRLNERMFHPSGDCHVHAYSLFAYSIQMCS